MATEATTKREYVLVSVMRLGEEIETEIFSSSGKSVQQSKSCQPSRNNKMSCTHSIDHSSVEDGEVHRADHAMAVILQPM
ncbi:hypothetical protein PHLCEN_2v9310 [Hermanssonia centrifuga]|uniref:Uncharacterized protein n=1 Tax=Hermanssonia centrifuga TaxID=98765 RepID=A0A2R6NRX5_9APHY|nr:hypothetical protein PHLCEN_2v9310 [Hermanssonia centrifuga]